MGAGEDLVAAAPGSEYGQAFAPESVRQLKRFGDVLRGGRSRQVDGLGHPAVAVPLKRGLDADVVRRRDIVGGDKETA